MDFDKLYKKHTKKELLKAFLLFLDDNLKYIECEKVKKEGNWKCDRCDVCMIEQYVNKNKLGINPRIIKKR
jgi:hypothetical protein